MNSNILYAFIISAIASLSTLIGSLIIFIKFKKDIINQALSFAAGVMVTVSVIELLPSSFNSIYNKYNLFLSLCIIFFFLVLGFLISSYIESLIKNKTKDNAYLKIGILSTIVIILHNIPEGIITFITSSSNIELGIIISIAIGLHNIPEGISIALPLYYAKKSRGIAILYSFIAGFSELFGSILAFFFLSNIVNDLFLGTLYSLIAGIMINISIGEFLQLTLKKNRKEALVFFIIGITIMLMLHYII